MLPSHEMAKWKAKRPQRKAPPTPARGVPCAILMFTGLAVLLVVLYLLLKNLTLS